MARFDVYRNENTQSGKRFPFFLSVQSELLEPLATCVVVPLGRATVVANRPAQTLTPTLDVNGEALVMYTPEIAAVYANVLRKHVCNLGAQHATIVRALDFLFSGV
ncbi:MAG TPA: CcdB family protein [Casimicrobiaceae bacterium]|nr:CcdB family protein [Casimicrobiaceae bacterium]